MKDIVFEICDRMLRNSPERSYKRLNPALRSTLACCIEADLPFLPSTFERIHNELRGHWWFGDGAGSHKGEHFYTMACGCNHSSAQQSFEKFAKRPACLWEEYARTPVRLCVGARFTWRGYFLTVTSLRKDDLVACTYKRHYQEVQGIKAGATIGYNPEYVITSSKRDGAATVLRVIKVVRRHGGERDVARRFVIPYSEITEFRRSAKARVRAMVEKISACDPQKDSEKLTKEINATHFRHFELEEIQTAFQARKEWITNQEAIEDWRKGKNGAWLDIKTIALRVNGDLVECSNGNSVSKSAAAAVLPVVLAHRAKSATLGIPLDSYRIDRVSENGVKIGCTLVPWVEIDRIAPELLAA